MPLFPWAGEHSEVAAPDDWMHQTWASVHIIKLNGIASHSGTDSHKKHYVHDLLNSSRYLDRLILYHITYNPLQPTECFLLSIYHYQSYPTCSTKTLSMMEPSIPAASILIKNIFFIEI